VRTDKVFEVHRLPTVWQMTSTVTATTNASLAEIFGALFPGASVTGAPKIASMAVIAELERSPRQIYTGAIGYLGPDAPRRKAQFSLAIRTTWIDKASGQATYGVGGGIVWDSTAAEEFAEIRTKTRVLERGENTATFDLLETMLWLPEEGFKLRDRHLARVTASAEYFGIALDEGTIAATLQQAERSFDGQPHRVRLLIDQSGQPRVEAALFLPGVVPGENRPQSVGLARDPVDTRDVFLYHKTTRRVTYQQAAAGLPEAVEPLLWNEQGLVTESIIANVVFSQQGRLYTPPVSSGLLPGTVRQELLQEGRIEERELPIEELENLEALYLISSLRGWRRAELIAGA
jgi:para-aminobenzoate synthetase/4-amino-4-deoxychorismate lyase